MRPGGNLFLLVPALAGVLGVVLAARRPTVGLMLTVMGSLPGLLVMTTGMVHGPWGILYALPFGVPTVLMGWGAVRIAGTARVFDARIKVTEVAFRCVRCGLKFAPYPNAWNNAGFCSRKCLFMTR